MLLNSHMVLDGNKILDTFLQIVTMLAGTHLDGKDNE